MRNEATSFQAAGQEIIARLNARWDVRLDDLINNPALDFEQRRQLLTSKMVECALTEIDEYHHAMGLPIEDRVDSQTLIEQAMSAQGVELEPNLSFLESRFREIREYRGDRVKDFIVTLSNRLEVMSQAKSPGQLALEILTAGLFSVGTSMAGLTIGALRAGQVLSVALRIGVTSLGIKTAVVVVVIVLAAFLLYLFMENPKKILGLVLNDTDDDLVVRDWRRGVDGGTGGELFMQHGHMANFPEDHATGDLSSPLVQIRKRAFFGPNDPDNVVFAGFYFANKNFGLRGAEGVMLFQPGASNKRYAHMFACPYVNDNGTNMRPVHGGAGQLPGLYRDMYNTRRERVDFVHDGVRMTSTVNHPRGGVVGLIASFSKV
ncbi:MAG: hypothetical protein J7515_03930 [Caulobacter sp.]|nr:hypothetical protein [Caulobacter sp.]